MATFKLVGVCNTCCVSNYKKNILFLVTLLSLALPQVSLGDSSALLQIGVPLPLTGEAASFGTAIRNGISLALDEGAEKTVQVHYEDDQYLPAKTVGAGKRFIEVDKVNLLISIGSTPSHALAPVIESAAIPLLAWASDATVAANKKYVIRTYPSSKEEGQAIADEALNKNYKSVAMFYSQNDYTESVRNSVRNGIGASSIVYDEEMPNRVVDFIPSLLKAKAKGAEAYFICLTPGNSGLFAKQLRRIHVASPIFGCEALNDDAEVASAQGALRGAWFVTNAVSKDFEDQYLKKFGNINLLSAAALHHDLIAALSKLYVPGMSGESLAKAFLTLGTQTGAVPAWTPTKTTDDQYIKFDFVVKNVPETLDQTALQQ